MSESAELYRARSDAAEHLTYALLAADPDRIAAAREETRAADALADVSARDSAKLPSLAIRAAVAQNDPILAASLGWLATNDLNAIVSNNPAGYLEPQAAHDYSERGIAALRVAVLAKINGVPYKAMAAKFAIPRRGAYALARGDVTDTDQLSAFLVEQGLIPGNDEDAPKTDRERQSGD